MKTELWTSVCLGGMLAGLVWVIQAIPRMEAPEVVEESPAAKKERTWETRGRAVLADLNEADSVETKLAALSRLQDLDFAGLEREMKALTAKDMRGKEVVGFLERSRERELSFGVQAMILRLAEIDPSAAVAFIQKHWIEHSDELWQAWGLVSAEWAHQDPMSLLDFCIETQLAIWEGKSKGPISTVSISPEDLSELLLAGRPLGPMTLIHLSADYWTDSTGRDRFVSTLRSERDFKEALDTWNNPPLKMKERWEKEMGEAVHEGQREMVEREWDPKTDSMAQKIILRWRKVDEKGFLASEFVGWESGM